jgi:hypothetical protein
MNFHRFLSRRTSIVVAGALLGSAALGPCSWSALPGVLPRLAQAAATEQVLVDFQQPFLFAYTSWENKVKTQGGVALLRGDGVTGQGGAGFNADLDWKAQAAQMPVLRVRVGAANKVRELIFRVLDDKEAQSTWNYVLPTPGNDWVTLSPKDGATLAEPNTREKGTVDLGRIKQWQIQGNWDAGALDVEVQSMTAVAPDAAALQARTARAQREAEAREAAIRAEEELRKKFPSNADLLRVLPVTNRILQLHFREGHIRYGGVRPDGTFAPQGQNTVDYAPMDIKGAMDTTRYRIVSTNDAAYTTPTRPVRLGYKAKGNDFNSPYQTPQFMRDYWVYAELPQPMKTGRTYTIDLGGIAGNLKNFRFTFDEKTLRSPTIHTSHVGYTPDAPKYAYFLAVDGHLQLAGPPGRRAQPRAVRQNADPHCRCRHEKNLKNVSGDAASEEPHGAGPGEPEPDRGRCVLGRLLRLPHSRPVRGVRRGYRRVVAVRDRQPRLSGRSPRDHASCLLPAPGHREAGV